MKKIFTTMLLTLCAFIGLNAQKFEFRMNGEPVDDGETVTFYGKKHIVKPQYNFMTSDILSVHNLTDNDINYSVVVEVLENTMEAFDLQIFTDGICHIIEGNTYSFDAYEALPANGSAATLFNATSKLTTGHMLTKLTVTDGLESHSVIILFENSNTVKIDNLWYKLDPLSKVAEVTKSIETNPYYGDIEIPSSVDYNGDSYAVNKIGDYAFYNSSGLTSVVIPNSIETIGNSAFSGCTSLESINVPNNVKKIGTYAFSSSGVKSIVLPDSIETIEPNTFDNCIELESITIPNSVTCIGYSAFEGCSKLKRLINYSNLNICSSDYLTNINNEAVLYYIFKHSIDGWEGFFSNAVFVQACGNNITWEITDGQLTLKGSGNMFNFSLGESPWWDIKESINYIVMDDEITSIGISAFHSCSNLEHVWIPYNIKKIESSSFVGCGNIKFIDMSYYNGQNPESPYLASNETEGIIEKSTMTLVVGCKKGVVIEGIKHIGDYAFSHYPNLEHVVLPEGLISIGQYSFLASGINSIKIPKSLKQIGMHAFSFSDDILKCEDLNSVYIDDLQSWFDIDNGYWGTPLAMAKNLYLNGTLLTDIVIPDGIKVIKQCALAGWNGKSITIPKSVNEIQSRAFSDCEFLESLKLLSPIPPTLNENAFSDTGEIKKSLKNIFVPYGSAVSYKTADVWKDYADIIIEAAPPSTISITIGSTGSTTFCSEYTLDFSNVAGIKAYTATGYNSDNGELTLVRIKEAKAGTGLYVSGNAGTYTIPIISSTAYNSLNMFVGVNEETTISTTDGIYTNYIYTKPTGKEAGFYKVTSDRAIPAGKAYLQIPTEWLKEETTSEAKAVKLVFDDGESTGIDEVNRVESKEDVIYDLQGRRVKNPSKGIYIINGRKVVR